MILDHRKADMVARNIDSWTVTPAGCSSIHWSQKFRIKSSDEHTAFNLKLQLQMQVVAPNQNSLQSAGTKRNGK
jgi:hypothetical protein